MLSDRGRQLDLVREPRFTVRRLVCRGSPLSLKLQQSRSCRVSEVEVGHTALGDEVEHRGIDRIADRNATETMVEVLEKDRVISRRQGYHRKAEQPALESCLRHVH